MSNNESLSEMFLELSPENKSYALGVIKALAHAQFALEKNKQPSLDNASCDSKKIEKD